MTLEYRGKVRLLADWTNPGVLLPDADKENYALVGWETEDNEIKDVNEKYYPEKNEKLKAVWDRPDVNFYFPYTNNRFFECNGTTYYHEPVIVRAEGRDRYFPVKSVYITRPNSDDYKQYYSSSYQKLYYSSDCDDNDHILLKSKSSIETRKGIVYSEPKELDFYIDHTAPAVNVSCDSTRTVNIKVTDKQSGINKIVLQRLYNGRWEDYKSITVTDSSKFTEDFEKIKVEPDSYRYKLRVKCTDHLDNETITDDFFLIPLSFNVRLSKINGTSVTDGGILHYLEGGNMMGYLETDTFGFADSIEYTFDDSLNVKPKVVNVESDSEGRYTDKREFLIPNSIEKHKNIPITVTVKREDEEQKATVYVELSPIDFGKIKSRIRRQPGQAN